MDVVVSTMLKHKFWNFWFDSKTPSFLKTSTCCLSSCDKCFLYGYFFLSNLMSWFGFIIRINKIKSTPFLSHLLLQFYILNSSNFSKMVSIVKSALLIFLCVWLFPSDSYLNMPHKNDIHIISWIVFAKYSVTLVK